jgi:hypothetical protein
MSFIQSTAGGGGGCSERRDGRGGRQGSLAWPLELARLGQVLGSAGRWAVRALTTPEHKTRAGAGTRGQGCEMSPERGVPGMLLLSITTQAVPDGRDRKHHHCEQRKAPR